jgi:hypothetical protein
LPKDKRDYNIRVAQIENGLHILTINYLYHKKGSFLNFSKDAGWIRSDIHLPGKGVIGV